MRLLSRYILKELFLPFFFSLLIIMFILFTNFLLRAIDRFLGKGLDLLTILEYLFLNLAWILALAVPMAVLITSLMTFGRLSEDNEITAMRASGISFLTIIRPALLFGILVGVVLVYFNNFILPEMNFRARILSGDIYRKRPGLSIEPGHFIDNLPDYSMIIREKQGDLMLDVRIFSKNNDQTQTSIQANSGKLSTIEDAIILTLFNGEIHELDIKDFNHYRRISFNKHIITLPADDLMLTRRDTSNRSDREMTVPMMLAKQESYKNRIDQVKTRLSNAYARAIGDSIIPENLESGIQNIAGMLKNINSDTTTSDRIKRTQRRRIRTLERQLKNEFNLIASYEKSLNRYGVEIHKKFSLPFACILFVLVGTPLGVLAKKGGFVVGVSLSFGFFLVYYILLIGGEEMADRNLVSPVVGMWSPNILLLIIASYLTLHTVRERAPFRFDWATLITFGKRSEETQYWDTSRETKHVIATMTILSVIDIFAILLILFKFPIVKYFITGGTVFDSGSQPAQLLVTIQIVQITMLLVTALLFLIWFYKSHQNLHASQLTDLDYESGWAIKGFFIPVLNLIRPYQVMREIWKGSKAFATTVDFFRWKDIKSEQIIVWWWIMIIISGIALLLTLRYTAVANDEISVLAAGIAHMINNCVNLITIIITIILVRQISHLQKRTH